MGSYEVEAWTDFAVAVAGTAGALTGLLFVAVSVNIQRILQFPYLPGRAIQTLVQLTTPLLVSIVLLIPDQSRAALGTELIVLGTAIGSGLVWLSRPSTRAEPETWVAWAAVRSGPSVLILVSLVVAGVSLIALAGGGLYWVAPVVLFAIASGLINAWVLLVEILR